MVRKKNTKVHSGTQRTQRCIVVRKKPKDTKVHSGENNPKVHSGEKQPKEHKGA